MRSIPFWPRLLGFAGLLPQLMCALLVWSDTPTWAKPAALTAAFYAALILSFLGGMWWGIAAGAPAAERRRALGWLWISAVVPNLVAFACLLLWTLNLISLEPVLVMLGAAILMSVAVDAKLTALAPRWWMALRVPLSLGLGALTIACAVL